jgi:uncharacterized membrane protein (DUF441 family)
MKEREQTAWPISNWHVLTISHPPILCLQVLQLNKIVELINTDRLKFGIVGC